MLRPASRKAARFALPGMVFHSQAVHVSQAESRMLQACEHAALRPLANQAYVPQPVVFPCGGLCLSVYIPPPSPSPGDLFS